MLTVIEFHSSRVMAAYGGLVFGTFLSKQTNGQNIRDIFEQTNEQIIGGRTKRGQTNMLKMLKVGKQIWSKQTN